ncbi:MAG: hypothetical protein V8Q43_02590 [Christensenellaceae bacterium]
MRIASVAKELGYLDIPEKMIVEMDEIDRVRDNKIVILATGSQGEPMSGLVRMAEGEHSKLSVKQGDLVILSSSSIPGNEKYVSHVINMLFRQGGARRIWQNGAGACVRPRLPRGIEAHARADQAAIFHPGAWRRTPHLQPRGPCL